MVRIKISGVDAVPPSRLQVQWASGDSTTVDVDQYLRSPGYERLRDPRFFSRVEVDEWGHGIEWPRADIGIAGEALWRLAKEQSGKAYPTSDFNAWMKRNGLSLAAAAQALHLTRRTIIYYSTGGKPIPMYIGLACRGWEALQQPRASAARSHRQHAARHGVSRPR